MSAIDENPREFSLVQRRGRWVLLIHAPSLDGEASSFSRETVEAIARELAPAVRHLVRAEAVARLP